MTGTRLLPVLAVAILASPPACGDRSRAERCADVEALLASEIAELPTACRRADDCTPILLHCGLYIATSGDEDPLKLTRLSERFESPGERMASCCGPDHDPELPGAIPTAACVAAEEEPAQCAAPGPDCAAACNAMDDCMVDPTGWSGNPDGCAAACEADLTAEEPGLRLRARRRMKCVTSVDCELVSGC